MWKLLMPHVALVVLYYVLLFAWVPAAIEYLAENKSPADIVAASSHESPEMRAWAAQCAQRFGIDTADMLSALAKLLYDEELAVKASAWAALKLLTPNTGLHQNIEDWQKYRLDK